MGNIFEFQMFGIRIIIDIDVVVFKAPGTASDAFLKEFR